MTKKLSDSMAWAAAGVPFELLKALPKTMGALKTTLDGFHDAPTGAVASRMLQVAIAEVEAHIADVTQKIEAADTSAQ